MIWRVEQARAEHIPHLAAHMREADRREVWASGRHTPEEALRQSLEASSLAWTCLIDGEPAFMWGAARQGCILSEAGAPWLLGTDALKKVRREFLRQSRPYVERMLSEFARLENYVHAENRLSMRWLGWCGFTVSAEPELFNQEKFFMFWRER